MMVPSKRAMVVKYVFINIQLVIYNNASWTEKIRTVLRISDSGPTKISRDAQSLREKIPVLMNTASGVIASGPADYVRVG